MGYSKLIRLEDPARHRLIEHGILDIAPLYATGTLVPRQNARSKPDTRIVIVQFDASDFDNSIRGKHGDYDENQNSGQGGAMKKSGTDAQPYETQQGNTEISRP